jgi:hypothetical protein
MQILTFLFLAFSAFYANATTRPAFCNEPNRVMMPWEFLQCHQPEDTMLESPDRAPSTGGCKFTVSFKYENGNLQGLAGPLANGETLDSKCKALGNRKLLDQVAECNKSTEKHTRHFVVRNNLKVLITKDLNCKGLREGEVKPLPMRERPHRPFLEDERRRRNRGNLGAP